MSEWMEYRPLASLQAFKPPTQESVGWQIFNANPSKYGPVLVPTEDPKMVLENQSSPSCGIMIDTITGCCTEHLSVGSSLANMCGSSAIVVLYR